MDTVTVSSTFLLTALMLVGLVFFIRASTKDRTVITRLASQESVDSLHQQLKDYFDERSYRVKSFEGEESPITWEGMVQASIAMALFLSFLAVIGLFCLALVLVIIAPAVGKFWFALLLLSPLAGVFYAKRAERLEEVSYRIRAAQDDGGCVLSISAHRDEIISLQQRLTFQETT